MTEMPGRIRVGPYVYAVSQDEGLLRESERESGSSVRGSTDHQKLLILVDATMAPGMQRQTLWHEVKHAVVDCLTMSHDKRTDEDWITRTAPMELAVLRDNPELVAYLLAEDDPS